MRITLYLTKKLNRFIKNLTTEKTSGPLGFSGEFYPMFKEDLMLFNINLHILFQKVKRDELLIEATKEQREPHTKKVRFYDFI